MALRADLWLLLALASGLHAAGGTVALERSRGRGRGRSRLPRWHMAGEPRSGGGGRRVHGPRWRPTYRRNGQNDIHVHLFSSEGARRRRRRGRHLRFAHAPHPLDDDDDGDALIDDHDDGDDDDINNNDVVDEELADSRHGSARQKQRRRQRRRREMSNGAAMPPKAQESSPRGTGETVTAASRDKPKHNDKAQPESNEQDQDKSHAAASRTPRQSVPKPAVMTAPSATVTTPAQQAKGQPEAGGHVATAEAAKAVGSAQKPAYGYELPDLQAAARAAAMAAEARAQQAVYYGGGTAPANTATNAGIMRIPGAAGAAFGQATATTTGITQPGRPPPFGGSPERMAAGLYGGAAAATATAAAAKTQIPGIPAPAAPPPAYRRLMPQGVGQFGNVVSTAGIPGDPSASSSTTQMSPVRAVSGAEMAGARPASFPRFLGVGRHANMLQQQRGTEGLTSQAQLGQWLAQYPAADVSQVGIPVPFYPPNAPPPPAANQAARGPAAFHPSRLYQQYRGSPGIPWDAPRPGVTPFAYPERFRQSTVPRGQVSRGQILSTSFIETGARRTAPHSPPPRAARGSTPLPCCCLLGIDCKTARARGLDCSCKCRCVSGQRSSSTRSSVSSRHRRGGRNRPWPPPRPFFPRRPPQAANSSSAEV